MTRLNLTRTLRTGLLAGALLVSSSCDDFLDVNTNPNGPQIVSANLYLAPMLHWLVTSPQWRAVAKCSSTFLAKVKRSMTGNFWTFPSKRSTS